MWLKWLQGVLYVVVRLSVLVVLIPSELCANRELDSSHNNEAAPGGESFKCQHMCWRIKKASPMYQLLVRFPNLDKSMKLASKWISDYVWRKKSRNGTQTTESANSTSTSPSPLACHKAQCNRIPKLFQWLLPLSHRHLSALIHDKLSHLIHDKSSEGPIETRRWGGGGEDKRMESWGKRPGTESAARHLNDLAVIA